ncbi:MAG: hypothetical protein ACO1SV_09280 [Fimbriimonas sp.]
MRRSTLAVFTLPFFVLGCGGSTEPAGGDKAPAPPSGASTRATYSFKLDTGTGGSGPVVISFTNEDAYYKYYEGTWKGQKVRFAEGSGIGSISIWNGSLAIATYTFLGYRVSDFPTVTKQSSQGQYSYYDSALRTQIKFKLAPATVSP